MAGRKRKLVHGSLFAGLGGFDLAAQWCGWHNAFHCEINEFCQQLLQFYWPRATLIKDINGYDWKKWKGKIDVLSGGFPCQPFSVAGKRKGTDDERHLWPAMLAAVRGIRPWWVVAENVRGLLSWAEGLVFDEVLAELEAEGYQVQPFVLPAAGVGAPHRRERVFFVAHARDKRREQEAKCGWEEFKQRWETLWQATTTNDAGRSAAHTAGHGREGAREKPTIEKGREQGPISSGKLEGRFEGLCYNGTFTDTDGQRRKGRLYTPRQEDAMGDLIPCDTWDRRAPWRDFPLVAPVCSRDDGLSSLLDAITLSRWRGQSLQALGNAVVPEVAYQVFSCINELELIFNANRL